MGVCLLIIIFIFVVVFILRKLKDGGIDKPNTYIQPISEFDITHMSTKENDFNQTTPTEQVFYHPIPDSHFDETHEKYV